MDYRFRMVLWSKPSAALYLLDIWLRKKMIMNESPPLCGWSPRRARSLKSLDEISQITGLLSAELCDESYPAYLIFLKFVHLFRWNLPEHLKKLGVISPRRSKTNYFNRNITNKLQDPTCTNIKSHNQSGLQAAYNIQNFHFVYPIYQTPVQSIYI
jgi:hypothetical protein